MRFLIKVWFVVMLSFCGVVKAADSFGASPSASPANAADVYREAMALYDQLSPADKAEFQTAAIPEMDPQAAEGLHGRLQPIMALLEKARGAGRADWGPRPQSLELEPQRSKELTGIQELARVTHWEAHYLFGKGEPAAAVKDLAIQVAMGRSDTPLLIGVLVQTSIRMYAIALLNKNIAAIPPSASADIRYIVDSRAAMECVKEGFEDETVASNRVVAEYDNPATRKNSYIQKIIDKDGGSAPDLTQVDTFEKWRTGANEELLQTFAGTEDEFEEWMSKTNLSEPYNPFPGNDYRTIMGLAYRVRVDMVYSAMLDAALAARWGDKERAESIIDPATHQPFTFTSLPEGTRIDSPMRFPAKSQTTPKTVTDMLAIHEGTPMSLVIPEQVAN